MNNPNIILTTVLPGLGQLLALAAGTALAAWAIGGVVLRLSGIGLLITGLTAAALAHPAGLLITALGAVLWALGHWFYAMRHHTRRTGPPKPVWSGPGDMGRLDAQPSKSASV